MFSRWRFWYLPTHFDLYFVGVKIGDDSVQFPNDEVIHKLRSLMPLSDRLTRIPMRALAHSVSHDRYQSIILPFWKRWHIYRASTVRKQHHAVRASLVAERPDVVARDDPLLTGLRRRLGSTGIRPGVGFMS